MGLIAALAVAGLTLAAPASGVPAGAVPAGTVSREERPRAEGSDPRALPAGAVPRGLGASALEACAHPCPGELDGCCDAATISQMSSEERAELFALRMDEAADRERGLDFAKVFFREVRRAVSVRVRVRDYDGAERLAREAIERPLPPLVADEPRVGGYHRYLRGAIVKDLRFAARQVMMYRSRRGPKAIDALLEQAALLLRTEAWTPGDTTQHVAKVLHEAFLLALERREPWRVCPTLVASGVRSYLIDVDLMICRGDPIDRVALRDTFARMGYARRRDVELWRHYLKVRDPLEIAAITTGALGLGASASAILLDQRYLALCRHTSADAHGCVFDESPQAEAARRASVAFAIAAPALLVTSLALYGQRWRERRARRRGLCGAPAFGVGPRAAAVSLSCRF